MSSISQALSAYNNAANIRVKNVSNPVADSNRISNGFSNYVADSVGDLKNAEKMTALSLENKTGIVDVTSAVNNAELTLKTVIGVRDKMIMALQDILKMPI